MRAAQTHIAELYLAKDKRRGVTPTMLWLIEEVGELSEAVRRAERADIEGELADVQAWLLSVANLLDVDLQRAFEAKYPDRCRPCGQKPCACVEASVGPL